MLSGVYFTRPEKVTAGRFKEGMEDGFAPKYNSPFGESKERVPFINARNRGKINVNSSFIVVIKEGMEEYKEVYFEKEFRELFADKAEALSMLDK